MLALLATLAWLLTRALPDGRLHVYFLDVGEGDAIFVRTPEGQQILVDGGPSPATLLSELGEVMPPWDRSIDLVVLTHPDEDHMVGAVGALERYHVESVLDSAAWGEEARAAPWRAAVAGAGAQRAVALPGMRLQAGRVLLTVVQAGAARITGKSEQNENDRSTVLRLDYGSTSVLLTGDAGQDAEDQMIAGAVPLHADVLKVAHHGSKSSSGERFLATVAPEVAVIQVGRGNRFGLPDPEVLARLAGITTYRTDLNGRIEITSDGMSLWARAAR